MSFPEEAEFEVEFLSVPAKCLRCPRIFGLIKEFSNASKQKNHILVSHSPEDFMDGVVTITREGLRSIRKIDDIDEKVKLAISAKRMGNFIEVIDGYMETVQSTSDELTNECLGAYDLSSTTSSGEFIGATVCRSPVGNEADKGLEPVPVFVYRRPPS